MKPFDLVIFHEAVSNGRIEWRKHVLQKLVERGLSLQAVREAMLRGERIRDYADETFSQCALPKLSFRQTTPRRRRL